MGFWENEDCEYCGGNIIEKIIDVPKKVKDKYVLITNVPAGICKKCGTRYYSANVLKTIEETIHGRVRSKREIRMPVYSM